MSHRRSLPEQEISELYLDGYSLNELSRKYSIDKKSIKNRLIKNGVKLRTLSEANRIFSFDENIFENIDSHDKAYWLGFIASDGSVYNGALKIGLSHKDISHLEKFKLFMKSEHKIKIYHPVVNNNIYTSCEISIHNQKLISDLERLNIVQNKSKILKPANIPTKYYNSYILGIIDGDGCFSIDKKKQSHLNIISSFDMCLFIMDTLESHCDISRTKIIEEKRSKGTYYCYFGGNKKIYKIAKYLYKDSPTFLDRKYEVLASHYKYSKYTLTNNKKNDNIPR